MQAAGGHCNRCRSRESGRLYRSRRHRHRHPSGGFRRERAGGEPDQFQDELHHPERTLLQSSLCRMARQGTPAHG